MRFKILSTSYRGLRNGTGENISETSYCGVLCRDAFTNIISFPFVTMPMSLVIPDDFLQVAHISEADLKLEIAILLFRQEKITLGTAS